MAKYFASAGIVTLTCCHSLGASSALSTLKADGSCVVVEYMISYVSPEMFLSTFFR